MKQEGRRTVLQKGGRPRGHQRGAWLDPNLSQQPRAQVEHLNLTRFPCRGARRALVAHTTGADTSGNWPPSSHQLVYVSELTARQTTATITPLVQRAVDGMIHVTPSCTSQEISDALTRYATHLLQNVQLVEANTSDSPEYQKRVFNRVLGSTGHSMS
ncbi:hypothetical protein Bpfe_008011 [Biomphalaria pfeifferi]|uniref:Uncharacterized protein n=1 Tax=Biomphalaria pfeifferi TaxID=112525 RepID=A0AAD8BYU1_BIOPF|nr:hypothetical protein Bpfe_008011 [Biomphalaria pfeifferi]